MNKKKMATIGGIVLEEITDHCYIHNGACLTPVGTGSYRIWFTFHGRPCWWEVNHGFVEMF